MWLAHGKLVVYPLNQATKPQPHRRARVSIARVGRDPVGPAQVSNATAAVHEPEWKKGDDGGGRQQTEASRLVEFLIVVPK